MIKILKKIIKFLFFIILIPVTIIIGIAYGIVTIPVLLSEAWEMLILDK